MFNCSSIQNSSKRKQYLRPTDTIISFKGSSTLVNFKTDILSVFETVNIEEEAKKYGITVSGTENGVPGSFLITLLETLKPILEALASAKGRLFITGHSLGGAYASLLAFLLAEGKKSGTIPFMTEIDNIHLVTFGATTVLDTIARDTFNAHLVSGFMTLDRVVAQKIPARWGLSQVFLGGLVGPNDCVPHLPPGFVHPGFMPLFSIFPSYNMAGRPYSLDYIRSFYGVEKAGRGRDDRTWPFEEPPNLLPPLPNEKRVYYGGHSKEMGPTIDPFEVLIDGAVYEDTTVTCHPNFVSLEGLGYLSLAFAHVEYLGMSLHNVFRLYGMKNPASTSIAFFGLYNDGVGIEYKPLNPGYESHKPDPTTNDSIAEINSLIEGGFRNRKSRKRVYKKQIHRNNRNLKTKRRRGRGKLE